MEVEGALLLLSEVLQLHKIPLMLLSQVFETVYSNASIVTIIDIDTWGAHPALHRSHVDRDM
jgi:hypothetical protein